MYMLKPHPQRWLQRHAIACTVLHTLWWVHYVILFNFSCKQNQIVLLFVRVDFWWVVITAWWTFITIWCDIHACTYTCIAQYANDVGLFIRHLYCCAVVLLVCCCLCLLFITIFAELWLACSLCYVNKNYSIITLQDYSKYFEVSFFKKFVVPAVLCLHFCTESDLCSP